MANSNLLKEAIADAKAVRETALANAKIALEEAFTPRIQSMLSAKLAEEEEMEEAAEEPVETNGDGMDAAAGAKVSEGEHGDEEMKEGEHGDDEMSEGEHGEDEMKEEDEPAMEEDMEEVPVEEEEEKMEEDLELEAIIKELEEELDSSDIGDGENKEPAPDASDDHTEDPGEGDLTEGEGEEKKMDEGEKEDMDEDISLDEIISALREEEEDKVEV